MIFFQDVTTGQIFSCKNKDCETFQEEYENPANLVCLEPYYCDGAGFNGKISRFAYGKEGNIKIVELEENKTNNEMEYIAIIQALNIAEPGALILSDSKVAVNQISKNWKCNFEHLVVLKNIARNLYEQKKINLLWIPRRINLAGKELEKK